MLTKRAQPQAGLAPLLDVFAREPLHIRPGGHTPLHTHPFEHLNYIIEGSGAIMAEGGDRKVKTGDFVLVMPNETHQYRNTSTSEPLVMICAVPKEYE